MKNQSANGREVFSGAGAIMGWAFEIFKKYVTLLIQALFSKLEIVS
jgi:hypothetical protein